MALASIRRAVASMQPRAALWSARWWQQPAVGASSSVFSHCHQSHGHEHGVVSVSVSLLSTTRWCGTRVGASVGGRLAQRRAFATRRLPFRPITGVPPDDDQDDALKGLGLDEDDDDDVDAKRRRKLYDDRDDELDSLIEKPDSIDDGDRRRRRRRRATSDDDDDDEQDDEEDADDDQEDADAEDEDEEDYDELDELDELDEEGDGDGDDGSDDEEFTEQDLALLEPKSRRDRKDIEKVTQDRERLERRRERFELKEQQRQQQRQERQREREDYQADDLQRRASQSARAERLSKRIDLHLGTVVLPQSLRDRIELIARGRSRKQLQADSSLLSSALRTRIKVTKRECAEMVAAELPTISYSESDARAYVSHRLPATYAANFRIYQELAQRDPAFVPEVMMDYGSGPGTSILAASEVWGEKIRRYLVVEPSPFMLDMSEKLLKGLNAPLQYRSFLLFGKEIPVIDFISASYVLGELASPLERSKTLQSLVKSLKVGGMLAIVEPGTPVGFEIIRELRAAALQMGTTAVSPCPHSFECPIRGGASWCHFKQRVQRLRVQLEAKEDATINWQDESFSYIVLRKDDTTEEERALQAVKAIRNPEFGRLMRKPRLAGGHVWLDMCEGDGDIRQRVIARSSGTSWYRSARKAHSGDLYVLPDPTVVKHTVLSVTKRWEREAASAKIDALQEGDDYVHPDDEELDRLPIDEDDQEASGRRRPAAASAPRRSSKTEDGEDYMAIRHQERAEQREQRPRDQGRRAPRGTASKRR